MNKREVERIVNISNLEQLIRDSRADVAILKRAIENDNREASKHALEQLDLKLHRMEAFEFVIERRVVNLQ